MKNTTDIFPEPEIEVEIIVKKYGEIFGKRVSYSFEGAEEDLGKLERAYNKKEPDIDINALPEKF